MTHSLARTLPSEWIAPPWGPRPGASNLNVSRDCLRFRDSRHHRTTLLCLPFLVQEHELRTGKCDRCIKMLLSLTRRPTSTHGCHFARGSDTTPVLLRPCSLICLLSMLHALLEFALFLWRAYICLSSEGPELRSTALQTLFEISAHFIPSRLILRVLHLGVALPMPIVQKPWPQPWST